MDIKLETYYSPSLLPSKVKTIIIDEVSREYQSIFYIKDKGVIKERFEDHFLINWIIGDAYTNVLKRYFENYRKSNKQSKSSFTSFEKEASTAYWNDLFNGTVKLDYENNEIDERKNKHKRVKQVVDSDDEIIKDDNNRVASNSVTKHKNFNDQNNENIKPSHNYLPKHQVIQKEKWKLSKTNLHNGNTKLLLINLNKAN